LVDNGGIDERAPDKSCIDAKRVGVELRRVDDRRALLVSEVVPVLAGPGGRPRLAAVPRLRPRKLLHPRPRHAAPDVSRLAIPARAAAGGSAPLPSPPVQRARRGGRPPAP